MPTIITSSSTITNRIGVVGGGITGSIVAVELSKHFESVVLLDQGRRGVGGRASHRRVDNNDNYIVLADDEDIIKEKTSSFEFDHGCQFFRADTPRMKTLAKDWCQRGFAKEWKPRVYHGGSKTKSFFGIPLQTGPIYVGVGGMHQIPRKLLSNSAVEVRKGTRVAGVRPNGAGAWDLLGVSGTAAYHDTSETEASQSSSTVLDTVDAVVFTDISSTFDSWHRASAGIPDTFRQRVRKRPRVALFSCMVALNQPLRDKLPYDVTLPDNDNQDLWFAACSQSKPGFWNTANETAASECWTLISTPSFAVQQIQDTNMQDPTTGTFKPQENDYLNSVPGPRLWRAFEETIRSLLQQHASDDDAAGGKLEPIYLQAHRWGSSLPAPEGTLPEHLQNICGVDYLNHDSLDLVYDRPESMAHLLDYVADDELRLYYAGDFCSYRNPGFEASALSGIDVAEHIIRELGGSR